MVSLYRMMLRAYPPHFRDLYGLEMEETFVDQTRNALRQGRLAVCVLMLTSLTDVVSNGFHERFSPQPKGSRMLHLMDVRYAFRLLKRSPLFTLLTVTVLSGGLGLAIFTFSFLHTAMLKPIPVADGDRVVRLMQETGANSGPFDAADAAHMQKGSRALPEMGVYTFQNYVLGQDENPRVLDATLISWDVFGFTRSVAMLGRTFTRDDAATGAEPSIVLSHRVWRAAFGSDSTIVGRTVFLDGVSTRVIGVMAPTYGFPVSTEAWMPLPEAAMQDPKFGERSVFMYGRRAKGVSDDQARTEMRVLYKQARERDRLAVNADEAKTVAERTAISDVSVQSFPMAQMGEEGPLVLAVLNTLAALILLLACLNVMNLLLARSNERVRETAVRLALGASRSRLIMQSMWESVILCVTGGAIATAIAAWGLDAINAWTHTQLDGNLAFWWVWGLDRSAIIAAGLFITATIAVLGLIVSGRATSLQFVEVLKDGSARAGSRREGRVVRTLVVTQVATVTVLMFFGVMSGIIAYRVANMDAGFETKRLLSTRIFLEDSTYKSADVRRQTFASFVSGLGAAPSVSNVLLRADIMELGGDAGVQVQNGSSSAAPTVAPTYVQAIEGDIATIGMQARIGRAFDGRDVASGERVAVVSQAFADKYFAGKSALGQHVRADTARDAGWHTVVGVVSNVLLGQPFSRTRSDLAVYIPLQQYEATNAQVLFKHRGDAQAARSAFHRTLRGLDPNFIPPDISSFDELLAKTSLIATSTTKLFAACFAFALLLAVSGTYGLMARNIGQRTREIGVRRALGASDAMVTRLLLRQGGRQLGLGVVVAAPVMLLVGIGFSQFLPVGIVATVTSAVTVSAAIIAVVLAATFIPTRRAVRTELRDALFKD